MKFRYSCDTPVLLSENSYYSERSYSTVFASLFVILLGYDLYVTALGLELVGDLTNFFII